MGYIIQYLLEVYPKACMNIKGISTIVPILFILYDNYNKNVISICSFCFKCPLCNFDLHLESNENIAVF